MPQVEHGTGKERGTGPAGTFRIRFEKIADSLVEGKEGQPDMLRVQFEAEGKETISLGVPLGPGAYNRLIGFFDIPDAKAIPHSEEGMRDYIKKWMPKDGWFWVEAYNGWVSGVDPKDHASLRRVLCEPGTHRGYLHTFHKFVRADGVPRAAFALLSTDYRIATFTCPWPKALECKQGKTAAEDYIGPAAAMNPQTTMWKHLCQLGLNWDQFLAEMMAAEALYNTLDLDGETKGYIGDVNDICPGVLAVIKRHGLQMVQWEMTVTDVYGLGVTRTAENRVELLPVLTESDAFGKDVARCIAAWDGVASTILGHDVHVVNEMGNITDDGKAIVTGLWRPVVDAFPLVVTRKREDGKPSMVFPITSANWRHDGITAFGLMAERLAKLSKEELVNPMGLCKLTGNAVIATWVVGNVPEFKEIKESDKKEEEL